ncbi:MAG: hypothetical protein J3K34DRAFT_444189 [Monoraphidium minutum]|nr:MAG: hypothetical protein J3K34DRAFT_444189 [Monoraphidium minutum]
MLHGASALIGQRTPLLVCHTFLAAWPYLPNMVKAMQLGANIYLPRIFFDSGVGLSAAELERGAAGLAAALERMATTPWRQELVGGAAPAAAAEPAAAPGGGAA